MSNPYSEISGEDILNMVKDQEPENLHLDYKSHDALQNNDPVKEKISRIISAFANADGGTVIYGVKDTKGDDGIKRPILEGIGFDLPDRHSEWLSRVAAHSIFPKVERLDIATIQLPGMARYVVVLHVPASTRAPHQAKDKRFYRRENDQCLMMEEYEIREKYLRNILAQSEYRKLLEAVREQIYKPVLKEILEIVSEFNREPHSILSYFERRWSYSKQWTWFSLRDSGMWLDLEGIGDSETAGMLKRFFDNLWEYKQSSSQLSMELNDFVKDDIGQLDEQISHYQQPRYWFDMCCEVSSGCCTTPSKTARHVRASQNKALEPFQSLDDQELLIAYIAHISAAHHGKIDALNTLANEMRRDTIMLMEHLETQIRRTYPFVTSH